MIHLEREEEGQSSTEEEKRHKEKVSTVNAKQKVDEKRKTTHAGITHLHTKTNKNVSA